MRDAPAAFGSFRVAPGVRTPHQLVHHMSNVLRYACTTFEPTATRVPACPTFALEIEGFHQVLEAFAGHLSRGSPFGRLSPEELLQGPLADAMTHVGQLAMLRRLAGSPIRPEDFSAAEVSGDNLGPRQAAPRRVKPEWSDAEGRPEAS